MRCLYCGKHLPLLRKLKHQEFCSEEHNRAYVEEQEQLALGRLLEAQHQTQRVAQKKRAKSAAPANKPFRQEPGFEATIPLASFQSDPPGFRYGELRNHCVVVIEPARICLELPKLEWRRKRPAMSEVGLADAQTPVLSAVETGARPAGAPPAPAEPAVEPVRPVLRDIRPSIATGRAVASQKPSEAGLRGFSSRFPAPLSDGGTASRPAGRAIVPAASPTIPAPNPCRFRPDGLRECGMLSCFFPARALPPAPHRPAPEPAPSTALPPVHKPASMKVLSPGIAAAIEAAGRQPGQAGFARVGIHARRLPLEARPPGLGMPKPLPARIGPVLLKPLPLLGIRGVPPPLDGQYPLRTTCQDMPAMRKKPPRDVDDSARPLSKPCLMTLVEATVPLPRRALQRKEMVVAALPPMPGVLRRWRVLPLSIVPALAGLVVHAWGTRKQLQPAGKLAIPLPLAPGGPKREIQKPAPLIPPPFLVPPPGRKIQHGLRQLPSGGAMPLAPKPLHGATTRRRPVPAPTVLALEIAAELLAFRQKPLSDWLLRTAPSLPVEVKLRARDAARRRAPVEALAVDDPKPREAALKPDVACVNSQLQLLLLSSSDPPRMYALSIDAIAPNEGRKQARIYTDNAPVRPVPRLPSAQGRIITSEMEDVLEGLGWKRGLVLPWQYAREWWFGQSAGIKWTSAGLIAVLLLMIAVGGLPSKSDTASLFQGIEGLDSLRRNILRRAAVSLTDDFRAGLANWEGQGDWASDWSYDAAGFVRTGPLALFTPTRSLQDYHMEFLGQIEEGALSWVVRAADFKNYYVVKLAVMYPGPVPKLAILRYPVIDGKPGKVTQKPLQLDVRADTVYRVLTEVRGQNYVLSVQGQVVDTWSEPRLRSGGVGLFSARNERSRVRWVGVWHQYDTLGRLCAFLATNQLSAGERSIGQ